MFEKSCYNTRHTAKTLTTKKMADESNCKIMKKLRDIMELKFAITESRENVYEQREKIPKIIETVLRWWRVGLLGFVAMAWLEHGCAGVQGLEQRGYTGLCTDPTVNVSN